jgi:hypothetical protein
MELEWSKLEKLITEQTQHIENEKARLIAADTAESFAQLKPLQLQKDRLLAAKVAASHLKQAAGTSIDEQKKLKIALEQHRREVMSGAAYSGDQVVPISFPGLSGGAYNGSTSEKYVAGKFITGHPKDAALGLRDYLGVNSQREGEIKQQGVEAIRREIMLTGNQKDIEMMRYILDQPARGSDGKDEGHAACRHAGMHLAHFRRDPSAVSARLDDAHIAALRLCIYTSEEYNSINGPL